MGAPLAPHPTDQILYDYGLGKIGDPAASEVDVHLEACPACRQRVSELSGDSFVGRLRDVGARPETPAPGPAPTGGVKKADGGSNPAPVASPDPDLAGSLPPELADNSQYQVLRELGRGGMGVVYLARNTLMDRLEVLKVLNKEMLERKGTYDRFLREVRAAARLAHPNVVGAYSAVQVGHLLVFAMEYVEGADLAQLVKSRGPLPVAHACSFAAQAALGLQHAHERGMVHRDIKPANLMLTRQGQRGIVKILDFGLAKASSENPIDGGLTREGQMLGTPHYISPEQTIDAQNADIRADIYSLGCTLYYLLTGGPPFDGKSLFDILTGHQSVEARPLNLARPEVPVELAAVVGKMMAKERERRYQTPAEVSEAMKPFFKPKVVGCGSSDGERSQAGQQEVDRASAGVVSPASEPAGAAPVAAPGAAVPPNDPALMWKSLVAIAEPEHLSDARPPAPEVLRGRPAWLGPALALGIVLLLGLVVGWATGVFKVKTPDGLIVLEKVPKDSEILVDGDRITFTWPGLGKPLEIRAVPGQHKVEVKKDGFSTFVKEATFKTDESEEVTVRLEPLEPFVGVRPELKKETIPEGKADKLPESTTEVVVPRPANADAVSSGFVSLFTGKDLTGWKTHPSQPGHWRVENGVLIGSGAQVSHLYTERDDFKDFQLRVKARVNDRGSGGVCLRAPYDPVSNQGFLRGFGAQISSSQKPFTGSLWMIPGGFFEGGISEPTVPPNQWFTLDVIADGDRIVVMVDGKITAQEFDDKHLFSRGHIALEQMNPDTKVEFSSIDIKELPTTTPLAKPTSPPQLANAIPAPPRVEEKEPTPAPKQAPKTIAKKSTGPGTRSKTTQASKDAAKTATNAFGMQLVLISPGEFLMGSPGPAFEKPQHRVQITRPFYLGATEVTELQYRAVMGQGPIVPRKSDDLPKRDVSWTEAIAFCDKLSELEKRQSRGAHYRLPTEAEWEYACRAGSTTKFSFGDDPAQMEEFAWYGANSGGKPHAVGQKRPNAWGLYDMHGNAWEMCWDGFDKEYYAESPTADPPGRLEAAVAVRVARGGCFGDGPNRCSSAHREGMKKDNRGYWLGFRVARDQSRR